MPSSYVDYTTDGNDVYSITMSRLVDGHITITLDDVSSSNFTIAGNDLTLTGGDAGSNGQALRITRTTPADYVTFVNGSTLTGNELNYARLAAQYRKEESEEADRERLDSIETVNTTQSSQITALQDINAGSRLDTIETVNTTQSGQITALQDINAGSRLDTLETDNTTQSSQITALDTRLTTAEDQIGAAFAFVTDGTAHSFNSGTPTLVPFATTILGGGAAVSGQYTVPFDGHWLLTVTLTPDPGSTTVNDEWRVSIGTTGSPSARRAFFEVSGDPDRDTITFTCALSLSTSDVVGAYVTRHSGTGNFTLNTQGADNTFTGVCISK
jgi:hypothetical protein